MMNCVCATLQLLSYAQYLYMCTVVEMMIISEICSGWLNFCYLQYALSRRAQSRSHFTFWCNETLSTSRMRSMNCILRAYDEGCMGGYILIIVTWVSRLQTKFVCASQLPWILDCKSENAAIVVALLVLVSCDGGERDWAVEFRRLLLFWRMLRRSNCDMHLWRDPDIPVSVPLGFCALSVYAIFCICCVLRARLCKRN